MAYRITKIASLPPQLSPLGADKAIDFVRRAGFRELVSNGVAKLLTSDW